MQSAFCPSLSGHFPALPPTPKPTPGYRMPPRRPDYWRGAENSGGARKDAGARSFAGRIEGAWLYA